MPDLTALPLWANALVFAVAAGAVWVGGTRLSRLADTLAEQTGLGRAFLGVLLLGGITSLPEVAATTTASLGGNAPLAVNMLLGGVMMQTTILALADVLVGREALSTVGAMSEELLEGVLLVGALGIVGVGIALGPVSLAGFEGAWTAMALGVVLGGLYVIRRYEASPRWQPLGFPLEPEAPPLERPGVPEHPLPLLVASIVGVGAVILVAGATVAVASDAVALQTGLGASFVGAVFVAVATSLPEVSVTVAAVRLGQNRMAFANIFGTNLFDVGLLALADACYPGASVLGVVGRPALVATLFGMLLTAVYLAGIIERRDRTVLRMGWDSALVLVLYALGVGLLYLVR